MLNLAEYRKPLHAACRLPALGGAGRAGRRPQQGRLLPAHGAVPRARSRFRDAGRARRASPRGSTTRCAGSAPAGRSSSRRSACRGTALSAEPVSRPASRVSSMPSAERSSRRRARISRARYFLTLLWLPPAEDAARAERWLYEGRSRKTGVDWRHELLRWLHRPHRSGAAACRGLHARGPLARRRRDPDLSSFDDLDQAPPRARARDADASRRPAGRRAARRAGSSRGSATRICARSPSSASRPRPARDPRRAQSARLSLSLVHPRDLPRQDRGDEAARPRSAGNGSPSANRSSRSSRR